MRLAAGYGLCMIAVVALAVAHPPLFSWYQVNPNVSLGLTLFLLGHHVDFRPCISLDTRVWAHGALSSLLVFPAVGLLFAIAAVFVGAPQPVVAGVVVTAACPPGSGSNLVWSHLGGLPLAPVAVLCTLCTLLAGWTFPAAIQITTTVLHHLTGGTATRGALWQSFTYQSTAPLAGPPFLQHGVYSLALPLTLGVVSRHCTQGLWLALERTNGISAKVQGLARHASDIPGILAPLGILITASNKLALNSHLTASFPATVAGILLLHVAAYGAGYFIPWLAGAPQTVCRISSMQAGARNPAVGLSLAFAMLGPYGAAAVGPCAVSVWAQNVVGSLLAAYWDVCHEPAARVSDRRGTPRVGRQRVPPPRPIKAQ